MFFENKFFVWKTNNLKKKSHILIEYDNPIGVATVFFKKIYGSFFFKKIITMLLKIKISGVPEKT